MGKLLSLSPTPNYPYAALCHWDSANHLSSLPAGSLLGSAYVRSWTGRLQGRRRRGACSFLFLPVSGSPTAAMALDLTMVLGSRLQLISDTFRTGLIVPLRSTSSSWAPALWGLSSKLLGLENLPPPFPPPALLVHCFQQSFISLGTMFSPCSFGSLTTVTKFSRYFFF